MPPPENPDQEQLVPQNVTCQAPHSMPFPPKLDLKGNLSTNWRKFKRVWSNYEIASGLKNKGDEVRVATFLTCVGPDAMELFDGFELSDENSKKLDKVIEAFDTFCVGKTNETYERYCFNKREQGPNETIDTYVAILRNLARTCNYGTLEDSLLRDRIVMGVHENGTRKKLLQEPKLTLDKCIDICRANEKTSSQLKSIMNEEVQAVSKQPRKPSGSSYTPKEQKINCSGCGRQHPIKKCPAWGKECLKCGGLNHFAVKCSKSQQQGPRMRTQKKHKPTGRGKRPVHGVDNESSEEEYMFSVEEISSIGSKRINAIMAIGTKNIEFQLDSGSSVNILPASVYRKLRNDRHFLKLQKTNKTLVMFNKSQTKPVGKTNFTLENQINRECYNVEFVVVNADVHPILGSQAIQQMKMIKILDHNIQKRSDGVETINVVRDVDTVDEIEKTGVFDGEGKLDGKLKLEVDKSVNPVKIPVRKIPLAVRPKVKCELQRLVQKGIIEPVKVPTDWISSMVVVTKSSGKIRLCIDPKPLNQALKRNHYVMPTLDDLLPELKNAKVFSVADAKNGFWHVELDRDSSFLTTFATPWGRYRWKRMPFGISPAPEEFQRRMDEALEGLTGVKAIHDDILIYGSGDSDADALRDHDNNLAAFIQRCTEKNIKLNKEKLRLRLDKVSYMGHVISKDGLCIDAEKTRAISEMPIPTCKADVKRLLGIVNYVQKFAPSLSSVTTPLRELIKQDVEFVWHPEHQQALQQVKDALTRAPVLKYFEPKKHTVLQCDASQTGIGACLLQEGKPICYASRALTTTEERYAQIEKELLAVVFGLEKFETYTYGRPLTIESDHKPLEIITRKAIHSAPKRLQRMLLRLQRFDYEIVYKPGPTLYVADALSRAYIPEKQQSDLEQEVEHINIIGQLPITERRYTSLRNATENDNILRDLRVIIQEGWPDNRDAVPKYLHLFYTFRDELTVQDGLVFKGDRVVVPESERKNLIESSHSHIGIQGCIRRIRECLYWPGMYGDIEQFVSECAICNSYANENQREPIINHELCRRPWEKVGTDIFTLNEKDFLITVDYYSSYFEIDRLHDKTAKEVVGKLRAHFARHGLPDVVMSDNGPPFGSYEFSNFSQIYGFEHITSSPYYPQSNGKVENAVKIAKRIMEKSIADEKDPYLALLNLRNTPLEGINSSPAQLLFNRRTKTQLPMLTPLLEPQVPRNVNETLTKRKAKQSYYYDRNAKELDTLNPGDTVRIRPQGRSKVWSKARVQDQVDIRSYRVRTEDGREFRRNRRHLRRSKEPTFEHLLTTPELLNNPETLDNATSKLSRIPIPIQKPVSPKSQPDSASLLSSPSTSVTLSSRATPQKQTTEMRATPQKISQTTRLGRIIKPPKRLDL